MLDDSDSQHKKLIMTLILLLSALVVSSCVIIMISDVEGAKTTKTTKVDKIKKTEPLKNVKFKKGKYSPKAIKHNSTHILIIGGYCTCGKHKWRRHNFLLEKKVRYTKNHKEIKKGKKYKLRISPKISFNRCGGEFTVYNPGTTTNDIDLCFCGSDKRSGKGKYYMKRCK